MDRDGASRTARRRSDGGASLENLPNIYDIFKGEVASIQAYGAFIRIPRCHKQGLVHKSQISRTGPVENVSDVLEVGDRVYCKVIGMGGEEGEGDRLKISLSMKVVNQGDGTDLDPNQVAIKQEEQRRQKQGHTARQKIELGAVFNTVCKKCGCQGHLSQDCFQTKEGRTYALIPEADGDDLPPVDDQPHGHHHHKKKKKKESKHKKDKKHAKHKKHKHHKKTTKRKRESSSSSSSSSDSDDSHRKGKKHKR